ncbi:hypothetical protein [Candidatus Sodalis pierantonius]|uniref:hypothetical protein n=1 Tax=Candidatus Sodalis pierantonii TaxID=1486991 RepID=UPI00046CAE6E|nr:hypothetical protein [Candidatus Sodalis pierantonius]
MAEQKMSDRTESESVIGCDRNQQMLSIAIMAQPMRAGRVVVVTRIVHYLCKIQLKDGLPQTRRPPDDKKIPFHGGAQFN